MTTILYNVTENYLNVTPDGKELSISENAVAELIKRRPYKYSAYSLWNLLFDCVSGYAWSDCFGNAIYCKIKIEDFIRRLKAQNYTSMVEHGDEIIKILQAAELREV